MTALNKQALIAKIKKQTESFDTVVLKEGEAKALVEELEKAQRYIEELREWNAGLAQESFERQQYTKERDEENERLMLTVGRLRTERESLENIRSAAEKLVRCKGRYHSEQNYRALAALFGVKTPDLPPMEGESRTVTVKLPVVEKWRSFDAVRAQNAYKVLVSKVLAAAGIGVKGE